MANIDPLERVLARARDGLSPSDAQVERIWTRLPVNPTSGSEAAPATVAPGAGHVAIAAGAASGRWAAFQATGAHGWVAAALLVSGGFVAGYWAHSEVASRDVARKANADAELARAGTSTPAPPTSIEPAPAASAAPMLPSGESPVATDTLSETAAATPPTLAESERNPRKSPRSRRAGAARQPATDEGRLQELALLERIERALRSGDAPLARALLAELERRHPKTLLGEERHAARLMADCVAAAPGADLAAEHFLQAHPSSVYASRLRALCWIR